MLFNWFKRWPSISYGITVCNEAKELRTLLSSLIPLIDKNDEIIVLQDVTNRNADVDEVLQQYKANIVIKEAFLNNDFATFKNNFFTIARGRVLFQIDADEVPTASLIKNLKEKLRKRRKYDVFLVPRINIVNGYTNEHAQQWNWNINEKGHINFPDYQPRIVRLNGKIKWKNKVHEVFAGFETPYYLPSDTETFCLLHIKDIKRQEKQNAYYDTLADDDK